MLHTHTVISQARALVGVSLSGLYKSQVTAKLRLVKIILSLLQTYKQHGLKLQGEKAAESARIIFIILFTFNELSRTS